MERIIHRVDAFADDKSKSSNFGERKTRKFR